MAPKKPKLTPEERKELAKQRAEEARRLAELEKVRRKHDHLAREIKFGALTVKRHEKNWKQMLLNIAVPRMKEDLIYAWHNFERIIDTKDFTISLLMDELDDAEEQYMMNLRAHAENMDKLMHFFADRLDELKEENENLIAEMQAMSDAEMEQICASHHESEEYLKTMLYSLELERKEQEKIVRGDYLSKIDEENSKYTDLIQRLKAGLENKIQKIWANTKKFLKEYEDQTAERRQGYNMLREQDDLIQNVLKQQLIKMNKNYEIIRKLKKKFNDLQEHQEQKIVDLTNERQFFADTFYTLKMRLEKEKQLDDEHLTLLTVESGNIINYLRQLEKKGEKILSLAAICRKHETQKEKIMPFPISSNSLEAVDKASTASVTDIECPELYLFWQHCANADALRYSINEEREYLKRQNYILQAKIHYFCECLDCPSLPPLIQTTEGINITDGKLVMKNYKKCLE